MSSPELARLERAALALQAVDPQAAQHLRARLVTGQAVALHGHEPSCSTPRERPRGEAERYFVTLLLVVAVPDNMEVRGLHSYVVTGLPDGELCLHLETARDEHETLQGMGVAAIMTEHDWRV